MTARPSAQAPAFIAKEARLFFNILSRSQTVARFELSVARSQTGSLEPLALNGEDLASRTRGVWVNGSPVEWRSMLSADQRSLIIPEIADEAQIICEIEHNPSLNTSRSGLYACASGVLAQCEGEGFRKIAWHIDQPDCAPVWTCEIEADAALFPTLLSNGTLVDLQSYKGRLSVCFRDPFPKPAFLFAMAAVDLKSSELDIALADGSTSTLALWAQPQDLARLSRAQSSLARAIEWDQERYGLALDSAVYSLLADPDASATPTRSKGLAIFNSDQILASAEISTDQDYADLQFAVSHEYLHAWTGNRVAVQDWPERALNEGLACFRAQELCGEGADPAFDRIQSALSLIEEPFFTSVLSPAHHAGSHAQSRSDRSERSPRGGVSPEIIRMARALVGPIAFRAGFRLYIERFEGRPATLADFTQALREASSDPLPYFERWWSQRRAPVVESSVETLSSRSALARFSQRPASAEGESPEPLLIPIQVGFIANGRLTRARQRGSNDPFALSISLRLSDLEQVFAIELDSSDGAPDGEIIASAFQGFCAPILYQPSLRFDQLRAIAFIETDPWAKRRAIAELMSLCALARLGHASAQRVAELDLSLAEALRSALSSTALSPEAQSLFLSLPSNSQLAALHGSMDALAFESARRSMAEPLAIALRDVLEPAAREKRSAGSAYSHAPEQAGPRALQWSALCLMARSITLSDLAERLAWDRYAGADNLTDRLGALSTLMIARSDRLPEFANAFVSGFSHEPRALRKWREMEARLSGELAP